MIIRKEVAENFSAVASVILRQKMKLDETEVAIVNMFFENKTDDEIASATKLSVQQVRGKRQNIYAKFGYQILRTYKAIKNPSPELDSILDDIEMNPGKY